MNRRGIADLIPWYLNGTLGGRERQQVDAHVQECSTCRDELAKERRIYEEMAIAPSVEYMPAPSLKHLQSAIDEPQWTAQSRFAARFTARSYVLQRSG